jgi:hypothetical protein
MSEGHQFSLRILLWLVAVCALACWLLTLPALYVVHWSGLIIATQESERGVIVPYWPAEVVSRLLLCGLIFSMPYLWKWFRNSRRAD